MVFGGLEEAGDSGPVCPVDRGEVWRKGGLSRGGGPQEGLELLLELSSLPAGVLRQRGGMSSSGAGPVVRIGQRWNSGKTPSLPSAAFTIAPCAPNILYRAPPSAR